MNYRKILYTPIIAIGCSAMMTSACSANSKNFGLGGGVGTTGATVEAKYAVSNNIVLRGNVNALPVNVDQSYDGVDYEVDASMTTFGGFADLHPFSNGFHLTGGVYGGGKSADLLGVPGPATIVEIGDTTYTGAQIGTLRGTVEYADVAPFVGLGYDGFMNRQKKWSFNARAGVMFVGEPDVDLKAQGGLVSSFPSVQDDLQREAQNLKDELDKYKYYPVVSLGLTRRF